MALIPPSLANTGKNLLGPQWMSCFAYALNVQEDDVRARAEDPARMPGELEGDIYSLGLVRIQEIQAMLARLTATGLSRNPPQASNAGS